MGGTGGRVILHVGSPKTGTTFLQDVLWRQRDLALAHGLLLPGERFNDHFLGTLDVRGIVDTRVHPQRAVGMWKRLVAEAAAFDGTSLISHELYAGASAEQARAAVKELEAAGCEVHIVVTARDLVRQLTAEWQEHVKHRYVHTFEEFVEAVAGDPDHWFWRVQGFAGVLQRWASDLGADRLHVVTVPPSGTAPAELWRRFAQVLGIDPDAFDIDVPHSNSSLGVEQAELLRRVNLALGPRLPIPGPYPLVVKNILAHRILEAQEGTKLTLNTADAERTLTASQDQAAQLASMGVQIIGDLSDLAPPLTATSTNYPETTDTELLDHAVAAMADLLVALNHRRAVAADAKDVLDTARATPVRFALVQAARSRPALARAHRWYRRARHRD
ncbi:hypothetical protein BH09ACT11_BH09ACT11_02910 [soil metagenome]